MFREFVTSNLVLRAVPCLTSAMIRPLKFRLLFSLLMLMPLTAFAVTKTHVITFGKWTIVQWSTNATADDKPTAPLTLKVRPLLVDARVKFFDRLEDDSPAAVLQQVRTGCGGFNDRAAGR